LCRSPFAIVILFSVPTCRIIRLWCGDFQAECGTSTSTFTSAWRTLLRCNLIKWSAAGMGCKWQVPRGCCKKAAADQARLSAIVVRPHAGNGGCYEVGTWYMVHGYGIGYTTEDICVYHGRHVRHFPFEAGKPWL